jgi:hypothetical protein
MATRASLKRSHAHNSSPAEEKHVFERHPSTSPTLSVPVRFLIMSDTHDRHDDILKSTPQCDVLLHCGDSTEDGSPEAIKQALDAFSKVEAELKLLIAGNHEIALDKDYYLSQRGTEEDHLKAQTLTSTPTLGIRFLEEGTHQFTLKSGAHFKIFVSPWTPQHGFSAFQ